MKTEKQLELAEQLRDLTPDEELHATIQESPETFSPTEIAAHRGAYGQAKSDFVHYMEREPESAADYSSILRHAEQIRKAALCLVVKNPNPASI